MITTSRTVFTDLDVVVNTIRFEDDNTYAIADNGKLILDNDGALSGESGITVTKRTHPFQVAVMLQIDATVEVAHHAILSLNNTLDLSRNTLIKTGHGELMIRNNLATGSGTVELRQGAISGNGIVGGNINNDSGTIAPGNGHGVVPITGENVLGDGAGVLRDIYKDSSLFVVPEPSSLTLLIGLLTLSLIMCRSNLQ